VTGRAVFLDRDGVINEAILRDGRPYPPASVEELRLVPDAARALAQLKAAGFELIVVTNQPDVARGTRSKSAVEAMNAALSATLPIDEFCVCFHDDTEPCNCRKPKPGLLQDAALRRGIDLQRSFMIGDRWRDIDAGAAAGCRTILIDHQYRERAPDHLPDCRVPSLSAAISWILAAEEA
jgi:D-glycero-D-manno-heptose 1,7-bisphosphate phosphatase